MAIFISTTGITPQGLLSGRRLKNIFQGGVEGVKNDRMSFAKMFSVVLVSQKR